MRVISYKAAEMQNYARKKNYNFIHKIAVIFPRQSLRSNFRKQKIRIERNDSTKVILRGYLNDTRDEYRKKNTLKLRTQHNFTRVLKEMPFNFRKKPASQNYRIEATRFIRYAAAVLYLDTKSYNDKHLEILDHCCTNCEARVSFNRSDRQQRTV